MKIKNKCEVCDSGMVVYAKGMCKSCYEKDRRKKAKERLGIDKKIKTKKEEKITEEVCQTCHLRVSLCCCNITKKAKNKKTQEMIELRKQGKQFKEIAKIIGVTTNRVGYAVKRELDRDKKEKELLAQQIAENVDEIQI